MTQVGIIEAGRPSEKVLRRYGDYPQIFRTYFSDQHELAFKTFCVLDGSPMPKAKECDAWIITGSNAGVYEDHPWISPLMECVREASAQKIPMLGICFGHQIMAQALGGKVAKVNKKRGIGVQQYMLTEAGEKFTRGMTTINLIAAHQDQVVTPPPRAVRLAHSMFCPNAAFVYGDSGLSFQAHPEFTPDLDREHIKAWQDMAPVDEEVVEEALSSLDHIVLDSKKLAPLFANFLDGQTIL